MRRIGFGELVRHWPEWRDEALAVAARGETGFYLTGGTALGRIHLGHRYSEDPATPWWGPRRKPWAFSRWGKTCC